MAGVFKRSSIHQYTLRKTISGSNNGLFPLEGTKLCPWNRCDWCVSGSRIHLEPPVALQGWMSTSYGEIDEEILPTEGDKKQTLCVYFLIHAVCLHHTHCIHHVGWDSCQKKNIISHSFWWGLLLSAVTALDQEPATCGSGATCSTLAPITVAHTNISNLPWHCFKKLWNQFCSLGAERKIWGKPILHAIPVCQLSC